MLTNLSNLEKTLEYKFKKINLLKEALTHRSYLNETEEKLASNERLEFLGDAVLELLVSDFLFKAYPEFPEGKLTSLRSSIVNTKTLANCAKKLELGSYLYLSKGEEAGGGRQNSSLLADVFESVLGAIFIDKDIKEVNKILKKNLYVIVDDLVKKGVLNDYKSLLQEKAQEKFKITPIYKIVKEEGPDHAKTFYSVVLVGQDTMGKGTGKSKQEAEQDAAKATLEEWEG